VKIAFYITVISQAKIANLKKKYEVVAVWEMELTALLSSRETRLMVIGWTAQ
jgi:hypothetical protein